MAKFLEARCHNGTSILSCSPNKAGRTSSRCRSTIEACRISAGNFGPHFLFCFDPTTTQTHRYLITITYFPLPPNINHNINHDYHDCLIKRYSDLLSQSPTASDRLIIDSHHRADEAAPIRHANEAVQQQAICKKYDFSGEHFPMANNYW